MATNLVTQYKVTAFLVGSFPALFTAFVGDPESLGTRLPSWYARHCVEFIVRGQLLHSCSILYIVVSVCLRGGGQPPPPNIMTAEKEHGVTNDRNMIFNFCII